jgi:hypothetical protein
MKGVGKRIQEINGVQFLACKWILTEGAKDLAYDLEIRN